MFWSPTFGATDWNKDGDRDLLVRAHARRDEAALLRYREQKNRTSIDGLPAYTADLEAEVDAGRASAAG